MAWLKTILRTLAKGGNTNLRVFAICFSISGLLWFFQSMGREYTTDIDIGIEYINLPQDKTFSEPATNQLRLKVSGFGWDLLSYRFKINKPIYSIDLSDFQNQKVISLSAAKDLIVESIPGLTNILNLQPETIDLKLETALRVRLPIVSKLNIIPANGFGISSILPKPDSVTLFGPKSKLYNIKEIYTEEKEVKILQGEVNVPAKLIIPEGVSETSISEVEILALLEPLTEKEIQATIKVVGYRGGKKVNITPRVASLKLQTTLSQFEKVDSRDFEVYVDFTGVNLNSNDLLEVKVNNKSSLVTNFRVHPKYVDYFLEE